MEIIVINEALGVIWYTAKDYRGETKHVIIYGLARFERPDYESGKKCMLECLDHAFSCKG